MDTRVREKGLFLLRKNLTESDFSILDLGAGFGKMSQMMVGITGRLSDSVMVDALPPMMKTALRRNSRSEGIVAVYEALPFRKDAFDTAMAGFAIRDSKDLNAALGEVNRILKIGGCFLIVDLSKPDGKIKRSLIGFYWRILAPLIAFTTAGLKGLKFRALFTTYKRLPTTSEFYELLIHENFEIVETRHAMLGGVIILLVRKKSYPQFSLSIPFENYESPHLKNRNERFSHFTRLGLS